MELGRTITLDFIISDPTTGEPINADSTPSADVYEDLGVGAMYSPTVALRGPAIGHYLVTLDMTEANGFEKGKSYNLIVSATVGGAVAKTVLSTFLIDETMEKKTNVAAMLNNISIPSFFNPDMTGYPDPIPPPSLEEQFGYESPYEFRDLFITWYDQDNKQWRPTSYGAVPPEVQAEVNIAQAAIDFYNDELTEHQYDEHIQKEVQWRALMAEKLMEHTE